MGLGLDFRILDLRLEGEVGWLGRVWGASWSGAEGLGAIRLEEATRTFDPFKTLNPCPHASKVEGTASKHRLQIFWFCRHQTIHKGTLSTVKPLKEQQQTVSNQYLP